MTAPDGCGTTRGMLPALRDGELPPEYEAAVRAHLAGCAACREELELLDAVVGALRRLPDLPAPAGILAGVRVGIQPRPWHRRLGERSRGLLIGVPIGAVATVLVVLGVALFQARFPGVDRTGKLAETPAPARRTVEEAKKAPATAAAPPAQEAAQRELGTGARHAAPRGPEPEAPSAAAPASEPAPAPAPAAARAPAPPAGATAARPPAAPAPPAVPQARAKLPALTPAGPAVGAARPADETAAPAVVAPAAKAERTAGTAGISPPPPVLHERRIEEAAPPTAAASRVALGARLAKAPEPAPQPLPVAPETESWRQRIPSERAAAPGGGTYPSASRAAGPGRSTASPGAGISRRPLAPAARDADTAGPIASALRAARPEAEEAAMAEREPLEVLYVWAGDGDDLADLRGILGREGGRLLEVRAIDPATGRQELLPLREQMIPTPERVRGGWEIEARMPRRNFGSFLDAVQRRPGFRVLQRQAAPAPAKDRRGEQRVRIRLFR